MKFRHLFQQRLQRVKAFLPLFLALVLAIVAIFLSSIYLKSREQDLREKAQAQAKGVRIVVVVPTRALARGMPLDTAWLAQREVPSEYVHADVLRPEEVSVMMGQRLLVDVAPGKPLLRSFFSPSKRLFSEQLPEGVRAVTVMVDEISSISGLLTAGDRVDFLYLPSNTSTGTSVGARRVVPLLQDIEIKATDRITADEFAAARRQAGQSVERSVYDKQRFSTVTVALPPHEAQMLILAQRAGSLHAVLRNATDRNVSQKGFTERDLVKHIERYNGPTKTQSRLPRVREGIDIIVGGVQAKERIPILSPLSLMGARLQEATPVPSFAATAPTSPAAGAANDLNNALRSLDADQRRNIEGVIKSLADTPCC